jgi:RluA family pseudouridine synthase
VEARAALVETTFFEKNFRLLYEDENLMACDKPPNLVVHSGTGHLRGDSLIDLASSYLHHCARGGTPCEPFLVHRLDRDTSGVILIAKNRATARTLHESFRTRSLKKRYLAFCHGRPKAPKGVVDVGLARSYLRRDGTKMFVSEHGQRSESRYRVTGTRGGITRLEIELCTGRTHQIRVHMAHLACPIAGDVRYGDKQRNERLFGRHDARLRRLYLHAQRISFFYPELKRNIAVEAQEPVEFCQLWKSL